MAKSLDDRLKFILEDDGACSTCSGGGGSSGGGGDFTSGADDHGPSAGFDQLLKGLKMLKRKKSKGTKEVKESKRQPRDNNTRNILKASELDQRADKEKDRDKKFKLIDKAREIRAGVG